MYQADSVRAVQRRRNLFHDRHRLGGTQRAAPLDQRLDVLALDQAHVEIQPAVDLAEAVDGDHVWVGQTRDDVGFPEEPLAVAPVGDQVLGKEFQRDHAVGGPVERLVDLSHAALAEQRLQAVATELHARQVMG